MGFVTIRRHNCQKENSMKKITYILITITFSFACLSL